jgi:uncharacterized OsmC-like protein
MRMRIGLIYAIALYPASLFSQGAPMTIVSSSLGPKFAELRQRLASAGAEDLSTNTVQVKLIEDQHNEAILRGFTVVQDEPENSFGTGKGPTPTDYFLASIAMCENVIFARTAAMASMPVQSLETAASGSWDRRGLFELDDVSSSYKAITVETKVATTGAPQKVAELARLTHKRCPIHATLSKSATKMIFKLIVNGRPISL